MIGWLLGVAILLVIWGGMWKNNLVLSFGVLLGLGIAWLSSLFIKPYVIGMEEIPVWLPPLPLATIALILFVYGALVCIRGNDALEQKKQDDSEHH